MAEQRSVFSDLTAVDEANLTSAMVGDDARPTGRLRMLHNADSARLQQHWKGRLGEAWLDVPIVRLPTDLPANIGVEVDGFVE